MFDFSDNKKSMESIFNIFLLVCIGVALILEIVRWWYLSQASGFLFSNTRSTYEAESFAQTNPHLMVSSRNEDEGQEFSYSFWLLIQKNLDSSDQKERVLLSRGSPAHDRGNPSVVLGGVDKTLQQMTIHVKTYNYKVTNSDGKLVDKNTLEAEVNDLPLRRWNHIAICGKNNMVDVFVNGRMAQHVESPQPIQVSTGALYINQNGGFGGFMSRLHYGNYYYSHDQLYTFLKNGPAPIPDLNSTYGTSAGGLGAGGGLANRWWSGQGTQY